MFSCSFGKSQSRFGGNVRRGARRHVVEHQRKFFDRFGDFRKMRQHSVLRRLVVIRRDDQRGVCARFARFSRKINRRGGVVAARSGNNFGFLFMRDFDGHLDDVQALALATSSTLSPVVPHGTSNFTPFLICRSTSDLKHSSSIEPSFLNGVTSAVAQPRIQSIFIVIIFTKISC